jgi:hypothetical protein
MVENPRLGYDAFASPARPKGEAHSKHVWRLDMGDKTPKRPPKVKKPKPAKQPPTKGA